MRDDGSHAISCWPRLHSSHLADGVVTNRLISQLSPPVTSFVIVADALLAVVAVMDSGSASQTPRPAWLPAPGFYRDMESPLNRSMQ